MSGTVEYCLIDLEKKTIKPPKSMEIIGTVGEANARSLHFKVPKVLENLDCTTSTIYLPFVNAKGDVQNYPIMADILTVDGNYVYFDFPIPATLVRYQGTVFISLVVMDEDHVWKSTPKALQVNRNINNTYTIEPDSPDFDTYTELVNRLDHVISLIPILGENVSNADALNTSLEEKITTGNTLKNGLNSSITTAGTKKSELDGSISSAGTVKAELDQSILNGDVNSLKDTFTGVTNALSIGVANLEAYLGLTDDVLGLEVDYENKTFKRLAGAVGKTAGTDFDSWQMYGGRRKCNVADDGTILAYYGDEGYTEDGSNGQVMVYQPKFYYLVAPVNYDAQETGIGYHLRKANYYVSEKPRTGFRLHPAFYDANGDEIDYVLIGAYEGSLYDTSASAYITDDAQVMDVSADKFSSIAGVKPASGRTQNLTRPNVELLAQNRGAGWHGLTVKIASMEQLLCMIETETMDFQTTIGKSVVNFGVGSGNEASNTGSTASFGNGTGQATQTIHVASDGTQTTETANGKTSIVYRGVENDWGNIWKNVDGVNIWGNGSMNGGEPYVCKDLNFAESKKGDNYEGAGFTVANANGYISAMGYSTRCDWLFMASECLGNSSLPVGDYLYVKQNLNDYRTAVLGGAWYLYDNVGCFCWNFDAGVGSHASSIGGRLVYVPLALA